MNRERLFKALAEIVTYSDLDELSWGAVTRHYGAQWVKSVTQKDDPGVEARVQIIEMFLRLADGYALPKNVGLKDQTDIIYAELGINPENTGDYPP